MSNWEHKELRPLFEKLITEASQWPPEKVMSRTKRLGEIVSSQLHQYSDGKYRKDRNEAKGFFEAIDKFSKTGLPLSLDHFEGLIKQYRNRISPYPHYSGIKLAVPVDFSILDTVSLKDIPDLVEDETNDEGSTLTLM